MTSMLSWKPLSKFSRSSSGQNRSATPVSRGWRKMMLAATCGGVLILLINLTFLIVALTKLPSEAGIGLLYEADCKNVKRLDIAIHLIVNALGVLLLAASHYTMQCLNSPTRTELDTAHAQQIVLDIGIASPRNLLYLPRWKGLLWVLLALSSVPLHLLWNSAVFFTERSQHFDWVIATHEFENIPGGNLTALECTASGNEGFPWKTSSVQLIYNGYRAGNYTKLSASQCLETYNHRTLSNHRNLIVIAKPTFDTEFECNDFIIDAGANAATSDNKERPPTYMSGFSYYFRDPAWLNSTEHCYSEIRETKSCSLQFGLPLIYIVVGCNVIKVLCMLATVYKLWNLEDPILATVGDAVDSFLQRPDTTTAGYCLLDGTDKAQEDWLLRNGEAIGKLYDRSKTVRVYKATSAWRWWYSMLFCSAYLLVGIGLLVLWSKQADFKTLLDPFGTKATSNIIHTFKGEPNVPASGIVTVALVANSFQLLLSKTYLVYNSLFTVQSSALEWSEFASQDRKRLRVSHPKGQQRSTFYLELPWRYGIPLVISSMLMHFLVSQSVFLARLQVYSANGRLLLTDGYSELRFSASAILTTICAGCFLLVLQGVNALRPLDNRMPIHRNRSTTISAMCHRPEEEDEMCDLALQPLMWGVTRTCDQVEGNDKDLHSIADMAGHCSFTSGIVPSPEAGRRYK